MFEKKARAAVQRKPKDKLEALTQATQIDTAKEEEKVGKKRAEALFRHTRTYVSRGVLIESHAVHSVAPTKAEAKPLLQVVSNKRSYAQTVENLFDLSFLVNSGKAEVFVEDNVPKVGMIRLFSPF